MVTVLGNLGLIMLIALNSHLHTPMYFFLFNLSFIDLCYSSVFTPKMLINFLSKKNIISYMGCMTQLYFFCFFSISECYVLTSMSYDRYVAICKPLRYSILMSHRVCHLLVSGCWFLGSVDGFMLTPITMTFPFCRSREIHHFFCEVPAVMKLSCSDTSLYETLMYLCCVLMLLIPMTVISSSYSFILLTIHRMNSAEGRKKAFMTCSSHMTVVILFYGTSTYSYMFPSSYHTSEKDMAVSIFYTILTPVLNPLIYSLRNKDVTGALKKMLNMGSVTIL